MPKIRLELQSKSGNGRAIQDPISLFILDSSRAGRIREARGIAVDSKLLHVDAAPDRYTAEIEMDGYKGFRGAFTVTQNSAEVVPVEFTHKSKALPEFGDLLKRQKELLASFDSVLTGGGLWRSLTENQAAAFFQITFALTKKKLSNGRTLASYISALRRIGGAEIEDDIPDGKKRRAVGWRLHVMINEHDRPTIEQDLVANGAFQRDKFTDVTHSKFGLKKSHRETGDLPLLQIVLNKASTSPENTHADIDLDVEFHRSSPHDVFRKFSKKFPEVTGIYRF